MAAASCQVPVDVVGEGVVEADGGTIAGGSDLSRQCRRRELRRCRRRRAAVQRCPRTGGASWNSNVRRRSDRIRRRARGALHRGLGDGSGRHRLTRADETVEARRESAFEVAQLIHGRAPVPVVAADGRAAPASSDALRPVASSELVRVKACDVAHRDERTVVGIQLRASAFRRSSAFRPSAGSVPPPRPLASAMPTSRTALRRRERSS